MRRNAGPLVLLALGLTSFGGFAWLSNHPDAAIVERAESWPFVGPLARAFRERWLGRGASGATGTHIPTAGALAPDTAGSSNVALEPGSAPHFVQIVVIPGVDVHAEPSEASPKILQIDAVANVRRFEKRGDWHKIRYRSQTGWIHLEGWDETSDEPPYGRRPDPPRPLPAQPPRPAALAAARAALGDAERVLTLGPYTLYTDCGDDALLERLDRLAAGVEAAYVERTGRTPVGAPREALVIFAEEASYRQVQESSKRIAGIAASGHTAGGLAVLYLGRQSAVQVGSTLVHEIVHLLNRRSLGPALPSWLDEGLADDLALSKVDDDGRLRFGTLSVEIAVGGSSFTVQGGKAHLKLLVDSLERGVAPAVRELLALDWESFVAGERSRMNYSAAAMWVRFLLDAEGGAHAAAFRDFLAAIAAGRPPSSESLRERLELDWAELDGRFRAFVRELWEVDLPSPSAPQEGGAASPEGGDG